MSTKFGQIIKGEENKAQELQQRSYFDSHKENIKVDSSFAKCIDDFLSGKTTLMPPQEHVINLLAQSKFSIASQGYGYIVFNDLKIEHYEPLDNSFTRIDTIKPNNYYAIKIRETTNQISEIDINKDPMFDKSKVEQLQLYLNLCLENVHHKSR